MGVSETILAAMIGAFATVTTAVVQLLRNRVPDAARPRRSRIRSYFSIVALMLASGVAGFAYSELRDIGTRDEIAALRGELLQREALQRSSATTLSSALATSVGKADSAEAIAHLPPCTAASPEDLASAYCNDAAVQRVTLCVGIPAAARVRRAQLLARGVATGEDWSPIDAATQMGGPVRTVGETFSYDSGADARALCRVVGNWTATQTQVARLVIELDHGDSI